MGAYTRRRLRAAVSFLIRPLIFAICLTVLVRHFFGPSKPKEHFSKALVIASTSDLPETTTSWIKSVPHDWEVHNYVTDAPTSPDLAVPINKGNEAMVYLTYIIDHYHDLPDIVFFHHSHRKAWHQLTDSLFEVEHLRPSYVAKKGYVSARCLNNCENVITLAKYSVDFKDFRKVGRDVWLVSLLDEFIERSKGERVPRKIAAPCCAQFAASREAIRGRSLKWWKKLRQWLIDTPLGNKEAGRLMEYTWHIWLGEEMYQ